MLFGSSHISLFESVFTEIICKFGCILLLTICCLISSHPCLA
uniref:Uncharacterized protein n=1 Tax=Arundo donax TaxID=35708 RepID=A0A0A9HTM9_ARUDO